MPSLMVIPPAPEQPVPRQRVVSEPLWYSTDVVKAARLLSSPPMWVDFGSERERRTVYTLIYDVFRYKDVLERALKDSGFYVLHPEFKNCQRVSRLLLYELHARCYNERSRADARRFRDLLDGWGLAGLLPLLEIEAALLQLRTRVAAAVARQRIANNALSLGDMLPARLRGSSRQPLTAWINKHKVDQPLDVVVELGATLGLRYSWDELCPMLLCFESGSARSLLRCIPVRRRRLVPLDRSFCYGPAMFCRLFHELHMSGTALMTHATSPRALAYLASLASQNERMFSVLAFGTGERKAEFEDYLHLLGVDNVLVYAKRLLDMDPQADIFENVVAVLGTPPNSCTAVKDPVGMVCNRGADLATLELLTDTPGSSEGEARLRRALDEQRETLAHVMARARVQFVLYETHSRFAAENEGMVERAIADANRSMRYLHAASGDVSNDEFEQAALPDLCFNANSQTRMREEGCYLALMRRREIIPLELKLKPPEKESEEERPRASRPVALSRTRCRRARFPLAERLGAHTFSSLMRAHAVRCPAAPPVASVGQAATRRWWSETSAYLSQLRQSLAARSERRDGAATLLAGGRLLVVPNEERERALEDIRSIDEIMALVPAGTRPHQRPLYGAPPRPRPHSRRAMLQQRIPFPVYNCSVELPERVYY